MYIFLGIEGCSVGFECVISQNGLYMEFLCDLDLKHNRAIFVSLFLFCQVDCDFDRVASETSQKRKLVI